MPSAAMIIPNSFQRTTVIDKIDTNGITKKNTNTNDPKSSSAGSLGIGIPIFFHFHNRIENVTSTPRMIGSKYHETMCSALFQEVEDMVRTRILNISIGRMNEGDYRNIEGQELETFLHALDL
jgi:hypothetical protein